MANKIQNREGFPVEFTELQRFFALTGHGKTDLDKDWNTPSTWKYLEDIPEQKSVGFALCGEGSTFAMIDYDHCLNADGRMFKPAYKLYKKICSYGKTHAEISMSGTGLHQFVDLGDFGANFAPESNADSKIIIWMDVKEYRKLPEAEQDKVPKVELFYNTRGRHVYLTGRHNGLAPNCRIATNETAAAMWTECLRTRDELQKMYNPRVPDAPENEKDYLHVDDETRRDLLDALPFISASGYDDWVHVGMALRNCGIDFAVWDEWSRYSDQIRGILCDKYNSDETPKKWRSFVGDSHWNAGTIFKMAKANGWRPRKTLCPSDKTDLGQAEILVREYGPVLRYSRQTGFLFYDGMVWRENDLHAQRLSQKLTDRQLKEAKQKLSEARARLDAAVESGDKDNLADANLALKTATAYRDYVISRRASQKIHSTLTEAAPLVQLDVKELDKDGFLLNTPDGTINLRTGEMRKHNPLDLCTKITAISPDAGNSDIWLTFLEQITCQDKELEDYLQQVVGTFVIGAVKREELIIATGSGGNGKSTFFGLIQRILGDYSGSISSEVLTSSCRKNKSPEIAELRGKRFVLAAELEESQRLDTAMLKKLCSTDTVTAERKYRDPFKFTPSHHLLLFTNHLPKVGTGDNGTWDRLVVIPFNARFRGTTGEVKDYASELFDQCAGAALSWMVEGARKVIDNRFFIERPRCVTDAIDDYREENDWMGGFLADRCYLGDRTYTARAADLYSEYRDYSNTLGEFVRSNAEFSQNLDRLGFESQKTKHGKIFRGLRTKTYAERRHDALEAQREVEVAWVTAGDGNLQKSL